jgi:hypothetical protein
VRVKSDADKRAIIFATTDKMQFTGSKYITFNFMPAPSGILTNAAADHLNDGGRRTSLPPDLISFLGLEGISL